MILYEAKLRAMHGYEEGRVDAVDPNTSRKALAYKKDFLKHFIPIDQRQIASRLSGGPFYVTRKYDGEFAMIAHAGDRTVTINRSGRVRWGIPCIEEAGRLLREAGIGEAMIGAEIYVVKAGKRGRLGDLLAALAHEKRIGTLHLAVYDVVELDGKPWQARYDRTWEKLHALFGRGERVREVDMQVAADAQQVGEIYQKWVGKEHSEGLVVRSEMPFVYKIKPRHAIDVAVVGFSEGAGGEKGQVRSLLTALMPAEGRYQVIGRVGSGLAEELRKQLFAKFSQQIIPSEYLVTDANLVAFRMVRPDTVVEVTVGDLMYETEAGPKTNTVLMLHDGGYRIAGTVEGVKFIAPVFIRIRDDKRVDAGDVRLTQIEHFATPYASGPVTAAVPQAELPLSRLLFREVYRKTVGQKVMLQKYMVWKTNKEQTGEYPAYVLYTANFSTGRQEPLQRDVAVTDSPAQLGELLRREMERNIKSGWVKAASFRADPPQMQEEPKTNARAQATDRAETALRPKAARKQKPAARPEASRKPHTAGKFAVRKRAKAEA